MVLFVHRDIYSGTLGGQKDCKNTGRGQTRNVPFQRTLTVNYWSVTPGLGLKHCGPRNLEYNKLTTKQKRLTRHDLI
jgi:hypothetical protein